MQTASQPTPESAIHFVRTRAAASPAAVPHPGSCAACHLKDLCLPGALAGREAQELDGLAFNRRSVKEGQPLYLEGDKFQFMYAVRSGTLKSSVTLTDGREQVTNFHMAGDVMGLDGAAHGAHATTATALEDAEVCMIPFAQLNELAARIPGLRQVAGRLMSREIVREHRVMMLLGSMNAEERLGAFLLDISRRLRARGYSAREFHLRMSRAEIGSFLGMKIETVSRAFSAFQRQGLLEVDKRHVRIADMDGLTRSYAVCLQ